MKENIGCILYLTAWAILSIVIYHFQNESIFDAVLSSLGIVFGFVILFAIIAVPIEYIVKGIKEKTWTDLLINAFYWFWYIFLLFVAIAFSDIKHEEMYDYHDILYWVVSSSGIIFLFLLPVFVTMIQEAKRTKDYDEVKNQRDYYYGLLEEHDIIRDRND